MPMWIMIMLKSLGALIFLFAMTRLLGKKQIAQLTFFEYITGITLGEMAGFMTLDLKGHFIYGVIGLLMWTLIPLGIEWISLKSKTMRNILEGKGTVLIKDGKILEDNLKKERFSGDELLQQLRQRNAFRVADVEFAVLEANGDLSVMVKKEKRPLTASDLGIKTAPEQEPQVVILDGKIYNEPLATIGLSKGWLMTELEKIGVTPENVYLGQVDSYGQLSVDLYDDKIKVPAPQNKLVLMATLKKCAADLELFALASENLKAKNLYSRNALKMNTLLKDLKPYLES